MTSPQFHALAKQVTPVSCCCDFIDVRAIELEFFRPEQRVYQIAHDQERND